METKNFKNLTKFLYGGMVIGFTTLLSIIADIDQISASPLLKAILNFPVIKYMPFILNIIFVIYTIYLYRKVETLKKEQINDTDFWKKLIRIFRAIVLDSIPNPDLKASLSPIFDELNKRLPDNGADFKIAIACPIPDGTFKIVAERGMDSDSVNKIQKAANWRENTSFFSSGLELHEDKPYEIYISQSSNYVTINNKSAIKSSTSHFVVVIKYKDYPDSVFPKNGLGVLSIGIPQKHKFEQNDKDLLYTKILPVVKSIEFALLTHTIIDTNQNLKLI